jgi:Transposase IS116/IS110/IS902 family
MAAEIGDVARFPSARQLVGYAGLAPKVKQSGQSSRSGPLSKAGSKTLRWAAVEAAQQASEQPMAPALPGDGEAPGQDQRRQGRGRAQGPDRRLARALAQPTVQALPPPRRRRPCPGQLPLSSGRPTAHNGIEKPGQLRPTRCAAERRKRTEHVLHQPSGVMRLLTANPLQRDESVKPWRPKHSDPGRPMGARWGLGARGIGSRVLVSGQRHRDGPGFGVDPASSPGDAVGAGLVVGVRLRSGRGRPRAKCRVWGYEPCRAAGPVEGLESRAPLAAATPVLFVGAFACQSATSWR